MYEVRGPVRFYIAPAATTVSHCNCTTYVLLRVHPAVHPMESPAGKGSEGSGGSKSQ